MRLLSLSLVLAATSLLSLAAPSQHARDIESTLERLAGSPGTVSVKTPMQGTFIGRSSNIGDQFYGIPYAAPPVGNLRFSRTQPLAPFAGLRSALQTGAACLQPLAIERPSYFSEDCLFLNIYRPPALISSSTLLPTMVFIHGGSWQEGASSEPGYNATSLVSRSAELEEPMLVVTLNYRLGSFGFLAGPELDTADLTGTASLNPGYWDQRTALRWVQDNIASFGGDPRKVTLAGQSAGANSVAAQMLANGGRTEGLFRAAIFQSGSQATGPRHRASGHTPDIAYQALLDAARCKDLDCLRHLSADKLLEAQMKVPYSTGSPIPFMPVRDRFFVQELPSQQYSAGRFPNIPIISGSNDDEGTVFAPDFVHDDVTFAASIVVFGGPAAAPLMPQVSALYPDEPRVGSPFRTELIGADASDRFFRPKDTNQYKRVAAVLGDILIQVGRRQQIQAMSRRADSWSYLFAQPDPEGGIREPARGIPHSAEIKYVFNLPPRPYMGVVKDAQTSAAMLYAGPTAIKRTAELMSAAWIHFVNNMSPAGVDVPEWPTYGPTAQSLQIQGVAGTKVVSDDFRKAQSQFVLDNAASFEM